MEKIVNLVEKHATGKKIIISLLLTVVLQVYFIFQNEAFIKITDLSGILDMLSFYSFDFAQNFFLNISKEGVAFYLFKVAPIDLMYPAAYSVFFGLLIAYLLKKKNIVNPKIKYLVLLPFMGGTFDYLENITTVTILNSLSDINTNLIYILTSVAFSKWVIAYITVILVVLLLLIKKNSCKKLSK